MFFGNERVLNFMTIESEITGMRFLEPSSLYPVTWTVEFEMAGTMGSNPTEYDIALSKIVNWFEMAMRNVVVVSASHVTHPVIAHMENLIVVLPEDANDELLNQALYSKISAIAGPSLYIGGLRIKADDSPAAYHFKAGAPFTLPETPTEYTGFQSHFDLPWWKRNDSYTYEFLQVDENNPIDFGKLLEDHVDPLDEVESIIKRETQNSADVSDEDAEILRVHSD